jgi:hypothetical protein
MRMAQPPDEHRRIWEEAWQKAKADKARRRAENRSSWASSPANVMSGRDERDEAVEIPADPIGDVSSSSLKNSATLWRTRNARFISGSMLAKR